MPTMRSSRPPTPNRSAGSSGRPGMRDEAGGEAVELVDRQRALAFRRAQLHARQQAAEIAPAFLRGAQHGQRKRRSGLVSLRWPGGLRLACFDRQLRADERLDAGGERRFMKTRRAGDAVAIEQRDRRIAERRRSIDERFGQRRGAQETECGGGVKLDIHGRHQQTSHGNTEAQKHGRHLVFPKTFQCFCVSVIPCDALINHTF